MMASTMTIDVDWAQGKEGGGIGDRADGRDTGGEDVIHHDRGHGHKGDHGAQDQVGKGIDPAADQLMVLQDLGDLRSAGC